jgi:hypothetical protein
MECLQAMAALIDRGPQKDVTRNEVDKEMNDRLEAIGQPRRTSPGWGARLGSLVALGLVVRTPDRPCRASASRTPCQAYTLADRAPTLADRAPQVIELSGHITGSSTLSGSIDLVDPTEILVRILDAAYPDHIVTFLESLAT